MYKALFAFLLLFLTACGSPATADVPPTIEVQGTSTVLQNAAGVYDDDGA